MLAVHFFLFGKKANVAWTDDEAKQIMQHRLWQFSLIFVGSSLVCKHCVNKQPTTGRISETQNFLATNAFFLSVCWQTAMELPSKPQPNLQKVKICPLSTPPFSCCVACYPTMLWEVMHHHHLLSFPTDLFKRGSLIWQNEQQYQACSCLSLIFSSVFLCLFLAKMP